MGNLPDDHVQYMRQMIDGIVKLRVASDLYDEFHTWLIRVPAATLRLYTQDVGGFANYATIQSTDVAGVLVDVEVRKKAEQSIAFYALAIWRKYELQPITKI